MTPRRASSPRARRRDRLDDTPGPRARSSATRRARAHRGFPARAARQGRRLAGIGHRVVHGGLKHAQPVRVDAALLEALAAVRPAGPAAPAAQPDADPRAARAQARAAAGGLLRHRVPPRAAASWRRRSRCRTRLHDEGVRRYGFHGLSYEYIAVAAAAASTRRRPAGGTVVVCHLGNGASMCALAQRPQRRQRRWASRPSTGCRWARVAARSIPGVILYLMDQRGMDARAIEKLIYQQSGLLGVSGVSSDMRDAAGERGSRRASLAVDLVRLPHRARAGFARRRARRAGRAGVHRRHRREQRRDPRARLPRRGLARRDAGRTGEPAGGPRISAAASKTAAWVVPTNEELMIARHTRRVLG